MSQPRLNLAIFLILFPFLLSAQNMEKMILEMEKASPDKKLAMVDSFMVANRQYPFIENDTTVWFVFFSVKDSVRIAGDMSNWKPGPFLTHMAGTPFWYQKAHFPKETRMEYKFILNNKEWVTDPNNSKTSSGGFGSNSVCCMPGYQPSKTFTGEPFGKDGTLSETALSSKILKEKRIVTIYLPPGYENSDTQYPLVIFHDGDDYLKFANIRSILGNMSREEPKLRIIGVFVRPVKRDAEYSGTRVKKYSRFICEELIPWIEKNYRIRKGPENHATAGISNGGNIALWLAVRNPEIFGKVAAQSSNIMPWVIKEFEKKPVTNQKVYLDIGTYDIPELIPMFHHLVTILKKKGYTFSAKSYPEGHNWGFWMNHMDEAFRFLLQ